MNRQCSGRFTLFYKRIKPFTGRGENNQIIYIKLWSFLIFLNNCNFNGLSTDIDECLEKRSGCEQLCQNTAGSFSCSCFPGFSLNNDNTTCSQTGICRLS